MHVGIPEPTSRMIHESALRGPGPTSPPRPVTYIGSEGCGWGARRGVGGARRRRALHVGEGVRVGALDETNESKYVCFE